MQSEKQVKAVYDTVADNYADRFQSTQPEESIELAMIDYFASLLAAPKGVLDAGCGAGRMLPVLADAGCRPVGVDLSEGMIRRARQDHPGYDLRVGNIRTLPFPAASLDGILYWYSTIHTPDDELSAVFVEARRVLRPSGSVLVAFQLGKGSREIGQGYRRLGHDIELHRHHRIPDQMSDFLQTAGFGEVARRRRAAVPSERHDQAVVIARLAD